MKCIQGIQLISGSNEELLPDFQTDFPYIATCAELYKYLSPEIPWHWHSTAELFYMEKGSLNIPPLMENGGLRQEWEVF